MSEGFSTLEEYKVGWWRKGNYYRYCYGIFWEGLTPFVKYRTKASHLSNSRKMTAINAISDNWFPKAEYLGMELTQEEQQ
ncbi:hypothetical protein [Enterococcus faecalis]|uniref:hypothetical protein n=1 Tax=Enterococcus faecalis TaxID=1351 RepID=UPI0018C2722B|nr:hypothetical protein [Enterococcus faecalis]MBG0301790.1 hypothetical protein [Enterococcus faecalis]MBJ0425883.1 hypothetical protein [Enterococcus faecalis]MBJ1163425.1 hypothetical protein [Enterococcus faecalis]MBJ1666931.1 hypothetical protein [Enterococcus faecalis]MBJ1684715.1 hypothetical protein [Enterococcus faecalis]